MTPLFPLKAVLLPDAVMELKVFEPRYLSLVRACIRNQQPFGIIYCDDYEDELGTMAKVGCMAYIIESSPFEDGSQVLYIEGGERFRPSNVKDNGHYYTANVELISEEPFIDMPVETVGTLVELYREYLASVDPEMLKDDLDTSDLQSHDIFKVIDQILLPEEKRQEVLEIEGAKNLYDFAVRTLHVEIERLKFLMQEDEDAIVAVN